LKALAIHHTDKKENIRGRTRKKRREQIGSCNSGSCPDSRRNFRPEHLDSRDLGPGPGGSASGPGPGTSPGPASRPRITPRPRHWAVGGRAAATFSATAAAPTTAPKEEIT
jgi:hypothetical protein